MRGGQEKTLPLPAQAASTLRRWYRKSLPNELRPRMPPAQTVRWLAAFFILALLVAADLRIKALIADGGRRSPQSDFDAPSSSLASVAAVNDSNPIWIRVAAPLAHYYAGVFQHPYYLLYLTRRCASPCSYISTDIKGNRSFTQLQGEHVWLAEEAVDALARRADAVLVDEGMADVAVTNPGQVKVVLAAPVPPTVYDHKNMSELMDAGKRFPLKYGLRVPDAARKAGDVVVTVGHGADVNVRVNTIASVYGDLADFRARVRAASLSRNPWDKRYAAPVAFLPPCRHLHPGAVHYLARLARATGMHVYGADACDVAGGVGKNYHPQRVTEAQRAKLAAAHRFVVVWAPAVAGEEFFRAMAYDAVPVVLGPDDGADCFLPYPRGNGLDVRDYAGDPEGLAKRLKGVGRGEWEKMMEWRSGDAVKVRTRFAGLWEWSVPNSVCRVCEAVAATKVKLVANN